MELAFFLILWGVVGAFSEIPAHSIVISLEKFFQSSTALPAAENCSIFRFKFPYLAAHDLWASAFSVGRISVCRDARSATKMLSSFISIERLSENPVLSKNKNALTKVEDITRGIPTNLFISMYLSDVM